MGKTIFNNHVSTGSLPAHEVLPKGRTPVLQGGVKGSYTKMFIFLTGKAPASGWGGFKLSALFLSLLLLISLTMSSVNADSGSIEDGIDMAKDMVIRHMDTMRQMFPEIDEKARQTEEELSSGIMPALRACSNCHME